ncbi:MAG: hypothetical protein AVDCRST_MAG26-1322 [uncultured Chloroflexia bacterium]|uniref:DUF4126 domain-containing protein n=1 Tax=uncultured Chloroflexia bacterium TaxID=1672391 RepID=A0A6J4I2Y7_9CHLR|nr:MAG: hypothetical protein AVDCRST_MAG26-1322 [uncultured Chloroflexia bacterium]
MFGGTSMELWLLGVTLVVLTGLNAPLGMLALGLAAGGLPLALRADLAWLAAPDTVSFWNALLVLQFLADLYFVPSTTRDHVYLHRDRTANSYLHARLQSFVRPLLAALAFAALPFQLQVQMAAVLGFLGGTAVYWATAWAREKVAVSRGSVILLLLEMAKNLTGLVVAGLVAWLVPLALAVLCSGISLVAWWANRLRREQQLYPPLGGQVASEDS